MIARFEDTRDLRLMGGYHPGSDLDLDHAVATVPRIYDSLRQDPDDPPSADAFAEFAQTLRPEVSLTQASSISQRRTVLSILPREFPMSLYGVLRTGVSGMNAQSNKLGTIADNIANTGTIGYKAASTQFSDLVLNSNKNSYSSGVVSTTVRHAISDPGLPDLHLLADRPRHPGQRLPDRLRPRTEPPISPAPAPSSPMARPAIWSMPAAIRCSAMRSTTAIRAPSSTASATCRRSTSPARTCRLSPRPRAPSPSTCRPTRHP